MFCTKCGNQVSETAKFCTECGEPILPLAKVKIEPKTEEALSLSIENTAVSVENSELPAFEQNEPIPVKEEPIFAKEEPVFAKEEPIFAKEEPTASAKKDTATAKKEAAARKARIREVRRTLPHPSAGIRVLTVFLCIIFVLLSISTCLYAGIYKVLREERIADFVEDFDPETTIIPGYGKPLVKAFADEMDDVDIAVFKRLDFDKLYRTLIQPYIRYILDGEEYTQPDVDIVVDMVRDIDTKLDIDRDYAELHDYLEKEMLPELDDIVHKVDHQATAGLHIINTVFSGAVFIALIVICVIIAALILLCCRRAILSGICTVGVGCIVSGSTALLTGAGVAVAIEIAKSYISTAESEAVNIVLGYWAKPFSVIELIAGGILTGTGIIACVTVKLIRRHKIRRRLKATSHNSRLTP